ncbi:hypothetical protein [Pseudoduganella aquatica]|uniref:Uncharacterized protein n=1 Tax=Pseudoduganella aquatica TaxID=2660641 RepID=A0A7X4HEI0_9BURK|nr:hypothetical protein [Pseudoduganella aquatica]MYN08897.1 hypothetical protein [Pseudoduganella aquatica]
MESALDSVTGEVVEAEQLWLLDQVDRESYACRGCGVKVLPASYRPTNLVRPYFTVGSAGAHRPGCDVDGEQRLVQRGRQQRVTTSHDGFPVPYPSRLVLNDRREIADRATDASREGRRDAPVPPSHSAPGMPRNRTVGTIRQICRTFINFPYDRDLGLSLPGVEADKYYAAFKKLKWDDMLRYPEPRIFYAALRWAKPVEGDAYMEIGLDAGQREGGKLLVGHRVRIEWAGWSDARKNAVRKEIEAAREEAKQAFEAGQKQKKAFVFFLDDQDGADAALFRVLDHRLICCIVDEISYPKF